MQLALNAGKNAAIRLRICFVLASDWLLWWRVCRFRRLTLRTVPANSKVFLCGLLNMHAGKADLNKCY